MGEPQREGPANGESVGQNIAAEMLKNIVILNKRMEDGQALQERLLEKLDELVGYHEVYGLTMEILQEKRGKKLGISDLAEAYLEAADEIMPADDEPGEEDPLVERTR
jgi:hypothetical protein